MTQIDETFSKMIFEAINGKVCILMRNGQDRFSGLLVEDRGRHFIITASHCINDLQMSETFMVSTFRNQKLNEKVNCIDVSMATNKDKDSIDTFDIGVIEISESYADKLNCDLITRYDISSGLAIPGSVVFALGFPEDLTHKDGDGPIYIHPTPFLFISQVSDKWPELSSTSTPFNEAFDFIVHYEKNNVWSEGKLLSNIRPHGMSGCGIFSVPSPSNSELWDAGTIKFAGIQSGVVGKFLRVKRSELVVRLLDEISERA